MDETTFEAIGKGKNITVNNYYIFWEREMSSPSSKI